jgi:cytochrome oxidase Cu insertion factor (SCO1/SenC/PrrC family)
MQTLGKPFSSFVLLLALLLCATHLAGAAEVGQPAPDFELDSSRGGKIKLSNLRGKNVLINFYILDFDPT